MHALYALTDLPWPLDNGRAINAHHLLAGLVARGHRVGVLLRREAPPGALAAWPLSGRVELEVLAPGGRGADGPLPAGVARWCAFWGVDAWLPGAVASAAARLRPDYVEACGPDAALLLARLPRWMPKLWFAGDDAGLLHWTMAKTRPTLQARSADRLKAARLWAYERAVAGGVDAAVAVSEEDARALRRCGGLRDVIVTPNGVDTDYFAPRPGADGASVVFCGRLDFPPNVDAVLWFLREVWPGVLARRPGARFRIVGRAPGAELMAAAGGVAGVSVIADVADVRPVVCGAAVAVLPLRGGAGIKNKLLEAAAMGRAIVASPRAVAGLAAEGAAPWRVCDTARAWVEAVDALLGDGAAAAELGRRARSWAVARHGWASHSEAREAWLASRGAAGERRERRAA